MAAKKPAREAAKAGNTVEDKLARIGIVREQDLVLHLPLRYEDHTQVMPLRALTAGHDRAGRRHRRQDRDPVSADGASSCA